MTKKKKEEEIIKQLKAVNREYKIIQANLTVINNYLETAIEFYENEKSWNI